MVTLAIVEDNRQTAKLLKAYLEENDLRIGAMYHSGEEALASFSQSSPFDAMLVDIGLPGMSGTELIRRLKAKFPDLELIMLTVMEDPTTIMEAIKAGASGYVLKSAPREEIIEAITVGLNGGSFLTGKIARRILQEIKAINGAGGHASSQLTERESEVLSCLVNGESYKKIADRLGISYYTVNNHIRKIYEKLRVNSRGEAAALFRKN